jgi:chemotaxis protein CheX
MLISDDDLNQLVESVWQTLMGSAPSSYVPGAPPTDSGEWMTGTVRISGEWTGTVAVSCPVESVRQQAARMFDLTPESVSPDDMRDALGEIANVLGGNLKSLMPAPTRLSLPEVGTPASASSAPRTERTLVKGTFLSFSGQNHPFHVAVMQSHETASVAGK